jgi:ferredoxin--NADP+ reductase
MSTGTGLAPFMSIVRDPDTYEKFEQVILVHGVREVAELAYHDYLLHDCRKHEFLGEMVSAAAALLPDGDARAYREPGPHHRPHRPAARCSATSALPPLDPADDRVMICGSPGLLRDLKALLERALQVEGNTTTPGDFVIERAFVEQ